MTAAGDGRAPDEVLAADWRFLAVTSAVVCDEHLLFSQAFAAALQVEGVDVVVTSAPAEALAAVAKVPVDRVVMNVRFPRGRGLTATRQIRNACPRTHIFCLGAEEPHAVRSCLEAGADLVLSKKQALSELVDIVLQTSRRRRESDGTQPHVTAPRLLMPGPAKEQPLAAQFLTNRERDVLRLLVSAESTRGIADSLGISPATARGYIQSTLTKLGVHSRVEAAAYAVHYSVVDVAHR